MSDFERVAKRIDGYEELIIDLERQLTAIQALDPASGGDGEEKKAAKILSILEELGVTEVTVYKSPDERVSAGHRPNIVARVPGQDRSKTVWLMSHMDVVPPGDLKTWTSDPWTVRVDDGKIYGRGVEDNQQGMVASLCLARALKEEGVTPLCDLGLLSVADEETGNDYGVGYLLKHHKNLVKKDDLIVIPDAGDPKGTMIEVAEKSIMWIKFQTKGKQTHGSTPDKGVNAHKAACGLVNRLEGLYKKFKKHDKLFDPPMSTFEPTKREANVPNVNTIPGEDILYYDCRVLPNYKLTDVMAEAKKAAKQTEKKYGVKIKVTFPQKQSAAPPTRPDAPVARAIAAAMTDLRKRTPKPMGIGGGTVAKFFRDKGFPCAVWATQDEVAHEPNEHSKLSSTIADAKVFAHIALQDW